MQESETFTIDTHAIVKDMIAAGFTEKQAEVQVSTLNRFVRYNLATKEDVAKIERNIEELRKETKTEIEALRKEAKIETEKLRRDLTIRMGGIMAVGVTLMIATVGVAVAMLR